MENNSSNEVSKAIIMEQELMRGRDVANHLLEVVVDNNNNNKSNGSSINEEEIIERSMVMSFAEDGVRKVLRSFTNTLLLLNSDTQHNSFSIQHHHHQSCNSNKKKKNSFSNKSQRGCHKRKSVAPTWQSDSSILCEDGHAWRKYGQKKTVNSNYLRSYYKCSYKKEQDCKAIKHVQRIQEDPPLYRTSYYGHHTCKSYSLINNNYPYTKLEPASSFESSTLLCFTSTSSADHNTNNTLPIITKQEPQPFPPSSFSSSSTKQEPMEVVSNDHIDHKKSSLSNNDYDLISDYELYFNY
ncbi:hypothetical protein PIB30_023150 [Stylosanthes scabra]|uniref:WRKY domain-containing protein n=1 Tax=Stylosanthes scabra TaxID=79078 RepID=A0ABU6R9N4_9FABA|nr:hypothetical protein [Stylosanthes scabra]